MSKKIHCLSLLALIATASSASAQSAAEEVWALKTPEGTCHMSFQEDPVAEGVWATLRHDDETCPKALQAVTGWSMNNGDGSLILYSTLSGLEMVGRADKEEDGLYVGMIGDSELTVTAAP
jgi:hypothetical protein